MKYPLNVGKKKKKAYKKLGIDISQFNLKQGDTIIKTTGSSHNITKARANARTRSINPNVNAQHTTTRNKDGYTVYSQFPKKYKGKMCFGNKRKKKK